MGLQKESWDLLIFLRASEDWVDLMKTNGAHKLRTTDNNLMDSIMVTKLKLNSWLNSSRMRLMERTKKKKTVPLKNPLLLKKKRQILQKRRKNLRKRLKNQLTVRKNPTAKAKRKR